VTWGGRKVASKRRRVIEVWGTVCWLCRKPCLTSVRPLHPLYLTLDHVVPRSKGGDDSIDNLRPAHLRCNTSRGARVGPAPDAPPPRPRPTTTRESAGSFFRQG